MKKIVLLVILAFGIFNFGCEKNEYYVKYAVGLDTRYMGVALDITYINDNNEATRLTATDVWSMTIGPVDEDFNASLSVATQREISNTTLIANIQVSKNDGPFVIKASGESDTSEPVQIEYAIDF